ncbi:MAG: hypothetical protein PF569_08580 [Candidatus Woesearchaeota archaeon]|jgi:hypothetical protein|nr:hypothetical protein [Candidatus Woesearchaeota archaeon]
MIILVLISLILILSDYTITYSNKKKETTLTYHGLLWVSLDYWSIWRYESNDKPMKILEITSILL